MVKIECRDTLVSDADLAGFQMGLRQFKGVKFTSGKATPWQSKEGPCMVTKTRWWKSMKRSRPRRSV